MTRVALLWHMHQPYYEDLVTGEHILPWVRLHALKDYYGMVALAGEFPDVRMTFNLVPSLLTQLEAFAAGRAHDRYLELGLKPAEALSDAEKVFLVQQFFHAQRQRMIEPYPRYAELLARRGPVGTAADASAAIERFDTDDLRDLQVWQKLAWIDPFFLTGDERIRTLVGKGRQFSEEDKVQLRDVELELLNAVIPAYRAAAESGQIEISTSPFYHPILPLLCDTDIYQRTHPGSALPRRRFLHPEDALLQLTRAADCHERLFGRRPVGLWPSEGSVSDDMVPLVAQAGFSWMATDELILARTLEATFVRDADGRVDRPEALYAPYVVRAGGSQVACAFRDHALSDLIGFTYAGWPADAAADDFLGRLAAAGRAFAERTGGGEATIPIILDGENAWEHFEGGGRPFLRALYGRLARHHELKTVTMSEACRTARLELNGIFPGSWIDANFYIWIGHADDQLAWGQLADARDLIDRAGPDVNPAVLARAREEVLIAEGSDWCWWYGDDHSSDHDLEFDDLYRRHLRNVYRLLHQPVPEELFVSNISAAALPPAETAPTGRLAPIIDGEETSYFEWIGAGSLEVRYVAGAMHQTDRGPDLVTLVLFGFGQEHLYVRLDATRELGALLDEGHVVGLTFVKPVRCRVTLGRGAAADQGVSASFWTRRSDADDWVVAPAGGLTAAAGTVLEVAVPLTNLGSPSEGTRLAFVVDVTGPDGIEIERHPAFRPLEVSVPDAWFDAAQWSA